MTIHFSPEGQDQWLDNDEFSAEFLKLLGAAQEGGSMVSECFLVASRIDPGDRANSWHREWLRVADCNNERAKAAFERGYMQTARSNWLRAINYYQASTFVLESADARRRRALEAMRACARSYIAHSTPAGEVVEIPWLQGHALEGYFLPAPDGFRPKAGRRVHGRPRTSQGRVSVQGGALCPRAGNVAACRRPARFRHRCRIRRDRRAGAIWNPRSAM